MKDCDMKGRVLGGVFDVDVCLSEAEEEVDHGGVSGEHRRVKRRLVLRIGQIHVGVGHRKIKGEILTMDYGKQERMNETLKNISRGEKILDEEYWEERKQNSRGG